jgi:sterol desaturase/sphingolipid hydroxylase (fatty acid hydroxylase superfamily)
MDQALKPKHTGTKQIFESSVLEKLSRTHISIPISIFILISIGLLYIAIQYTTLRTIAVVALFLGGLLTWTFMEYILHRFVFHMNPTTTWKRKLQYAFHGVHHEYPKDKTRLAMPPLMSIAIASVLFVVIYLLINTSVFGFLPGLLTGYAAYLFVHYVVHAYPPPKNLFNQLWVSHAVHHYKDDTKLYGVSSPLWDFVFRTDK